jgi:hypothetical protein
MTEQQYIKVWRTPLPPQVAAQKRAFGNFALGRYTWMFSQVYRLPTPIQARGMLGVWEWQPPYKAQLVLAQLDKQGEEPLASQRSHHR